MRVLLAVSFLVLISCQPELVELRRSPGDPVEVIASDTTLDSTAAVSEEVSRSPWQEEAKPGTEASRVASESPADDLALVGPSSAHQPKEVPQSVSLVVPRTEETHECSKVDLVFVVDNSASMDEQQRSLSEAFQPFVEGLEQEVAATDLHVMAVDTDDASLVQRLPLFGSSDACDETLGAGRRSDSAGRDCGLDVDRRFLSSEQDDLEGNFECLASVGKRGGLLEEPVGAALNAISAPFNEEGGCNEGFLREDALLVLVVVTDEDDDRTDLEPADWHAELYEGRSEDSVVVMGLLGGSASCGGLLPDRSPRLRQFVLGAKHGLVADGCAPDYSSAFESLVGATGGACWSLRSGAAL